MRQRTKFIRRVGLFLLIVILLIFVINLIYLEFVFVKKNIYRKEMQYQEWFLNNESNKNLDYAFFGSSHCYNAISPKHIPSSFNFGSDGENYIKTYYKLDRILNKDEIEINNIILEIDPHTFSSVFVEEPLLFNQLELYSKFVPLREIKKIRPEDSLISLWIEANFPFIGKGKEFGILFIKHESPEIYLGGVKNKNVLITEDDLELAREFNYSHSISGEIHELPFEYFFKTIDLAKKNNINVIFIKFPYSKDFDEMKQLNNISYEDYYGQIFSQVNSSLKEDYFVLDYYDFLFDEPTYFADLQHVNYNGSEKLSKQIYEDLQEFNLTKISEVEKTIKLNPAVREGRDFDLILLLIILFLELVLLIMILGLLKKRV